MQPLNQVFERVDREVGAGLEPTYQTALGEMTGADEQIVTALPYRPSNNYPSPQSAPTR